MKAPVRLSQAQTDLIQEKVLEMVEVITSQPGRVVYFGDKYADGYVNISISLKVRLPDPEPEQPPTLGIAVSETINTAEQVGG